MAKTAEPMQPKIERLGHYHYDVYVAGVAVAHVWVYRTMERSQTYQVRLLKDGTVLHEFPSVRKAVIAALSRDHVVLTPK